MSGVTLKPLRQNVAQGGAWVLGDTAYMPVDPLENRRMKTPGVCSQEVGCVECTSTNWPKTDTGGKHNASVKLIWILPTLFWKTRV